MLVLHDDAECEYACGPANGLPDAKARHRSPQALMDEAKQRGWVVISMKERLTIYRGFNSEGQRIAG